MNLKNPLEIIVRVTAKSAITAVERDKNGDRFFYLRSLYNSRFSDLPLVEVNRRNKPKL